jgi:hypothetical protein
VAAPSSVSGARAPQAEAAALANAASAGSAAICPFSLFLRVLPRVATYRTSPSRTTREVQESEREPGIAFEIPSPAFVRSS